MMPRLLLLTLALLASATAALAQGSLTPSGAPAPSMKTLDQLEPRTPLQAGAPGVTQNANGGFTITAPGSYYLTATLAVDSGDGIVILSRNVTLDLGGFTIASSEGTPASAGIQAGASANLLIRNGRITSNSTSGFLVGIASSNGGNTTVEDIQVQGVAQNGIYFVNLIRNCTVSSCGGTGMKAGGSVLNSTAYYCGGQGIVATMVENCWADEITGAAISCTGTASNCYGKSTASTGISAYTAVNCVGYGLPAGAAGINANVADTCYGFSSDGTGIIAANVANSTGLSTKGQGIRATSVTNCTGTSTSGTGIESSSVTGSIGQSTAGSGIEASSTSDSRGVTSSGIGINTGTADNCTALTMTGSYGIKASYTVQNCRASITTGGATTAYAIYCQTALNCSATISGVTATPQTCYGLYAYSASNCYGTSPNGYGLQAVFIATGCYGTSTSGTGLDAGTADTCQGSSTSSYGLRANIAANSVGISNSAIGLAGAYGATNCRGQSTSGTGLSAANATGCYGYSTSGAYGLRVTGTANTSTGSCSGGTAISALIAVSCTASGGTISAIHKYNMP